MPKETKKPKSKKSKSVAAEQEALLAMPAELEAEENASDGSSDSGLDDLIEAELGSSSEAKRFAEADDDSEVKIEAELGVDSEDEALSEEGEGGINFELEQKDFTEDSELAAYDSAEIEDIENVTEDQLVSIVESVLFSSDKPQSVAMLKAAVQGTTIRVANIRGALERLKIEYSNPLRGVTLDEVAGGFQLRTKVENQQYLLRTIKARPFRLSGPALEVLSIVAYKQPCPKSTVDDIRGVESGHLMRGLLDRGLIHFAGKSELPGRPMNYETTRKFLEIFSLRNINELPSLNEIDELIPDGIGEPVEEKETLADLTGQLSTDVTSKSYSEGEEELIDISSELQTINTSTDFFEQEKLRQKQKRDLEKAQDIRERLTVGEEVESKDKRWLTRYEADIIAKSLPAEVASPEGEVQPLNPVEEAIPEVVIERAPETHRDPVVE